MSWRAADWGKTATAKPGLLAGEVQAAANKLVNARKVIKQIYDAFDAETKILSRLLYRNKNQFRSQEFFQLLEGLKRYLARLHALSITELLDQFKDALPSTKKAYEMNDGLMKGSSFPSLSVIVAFLDTLLLSARLSKEVVGFAQAAYCKLTAQIARGLFMHINLVSLSIVCRLSSIAQCFFAAVTHCFAAWRGATEWVQSRVHVEYSLPACIYTHLGVATPGAKKSAPAQSELADAPPLAKADTDSDADDAPRTAAPSAAHPVADDGLPTAFGLSPKQVRDESDKAMVADAKPDTPSAHPPLKAKKRKQNAPGTAANATKAARQGAVPAGTKVPKRKAAQDEIDDIFGVESD